MKDGLTLRKGQGEDQDWLFELFRGTMQDYIDDAWGWDELLQREGFITEMPATSFQVLEQGSERVGSYHITYKPDHVFLDMILVEPARQRQGLGRFMMQQIQNEAVMLGLPLRLSVLKTNPALEFHKACGFTPLQEDRHSLQMHWEP